MFKEAAKSKLRFNINGWCTVEDLWDVKLETLDEYAQNLRDEIKSTSKTKSFITKQKNTNAEKELQLEIAISVIKDRLQDLKDSEDAIETKNHNQKILGLIAAKEDEELSSLSINDLKKQLK